MTMGLAGTTAFSLISAITLQNITLFNISSLKRDACDDKAM